LVNGGDIVIAVWVVAVFVPFSLTIPQSEAAEAPGFQARLVSKRGPADVIRVAPVGQPGASGAGRFRVEFRRGSGSLLAAVLTEDQYQGVVRVSSLELAELKSAVSAPGKCTGGEVRYSTGTGRARLMDSSGVGSFEGTICDGMAGRRPAALAARVAGRFLMFLRPSLPSKDGR
jgi:hypothetical protein